MKATIIIVSYNNGSELFDCINSCLTQINVERILLVNNGNSDATNIRLMDVEANHQTLHLIDPGKNIGFGAACNLATVQSKTEALIFLNPDAKLKDDAISRILHTLKNSQAAIVGGLICDEKGIEQRGSRRGKLTLLSALVSFLGLGKAIRTAAFLRDFNQNREELPKNAIQVDAISGAFFAIRNEDFERLKGFDEAYFLHVEDIDLCTRHKAKGGIVLFDPNAIAEHKGGASKASKFFVEWHKFKGFMRYFLTYENIAGKFFAILVSPLIFGAIMGRVIISRLLPFRQK